MNTNRSRNRSAPGSLVRHASRSPPPRRCAARGEPRRSPLPAASAERRRLDRTRRGRNVTERARSNNALAQQRPARPTATGALTRHRAQHSSGTPQTRAAAPASSPSSCASVSQPSRRRRRSRASAPRLTDPTAIPTDLSHAAERVCRRAGPDTTAGQKCVETFLDRLGLPQTRAASARTASPWPQATGEDRSGPRRTVRRSLTPQAVPGQLRLPRRVSSGRCPRHRSTTTAQRRAPAAQRARGTAPTPQPATPEPHRSRTPRRRPLRRSPGRRTSPADQAAARGAPTRCGGGAPCRGRIRPGRRTARAHRVARFDAAGGGRDSRRWPASRPASSVPTAPWNRHWPLLLPAVGRRLKWRLGRGPVSFTLQSLSVAPGLSGRLREVRADRLGRRRRRRSGSTGRTCWRADVRLRGASVVANHVELQRAAGAGGAGRAARERHALREAAPRRRRRTRRARRAPAAGDTSSSQPRVDDGEPPPRARPRSSPVAAAVDGAGAGCCPGCASARTSCCPAAD